MNKIFLLSPARCDGRRAQVLVNPNASFALAEQLGSRTGVALGEAFSFLSGLYFRGKLAYATTFGRRVGSGAHTFVITTDRGLLPPEARVRRRDMLAFAGVDIVKGGHRFRDPLCRDAEKLARAVGAKSLVVLLGSIATGKYVDALTDVFGERLVFPSDFVGRGDMSRGGLLLRCVREGRELDYTPVIGAVRHGTRPAKLERMR
jgi:hypothetical protein